jgi:hypothetical protein
MAFSIGAQHIGPCSVEILDANRMDDDGISIARIDGPGGCAVAPTNSLSTDKGSGASQQCPDRVPPLLVTDDMCLSEWTFTVQNADRITCGDNCVMRWLWSAQHISVDQPEEYENCADVAIVTGSPAAVEANQNAVTRVIPSASPSAAAISSTMPPNMPPSIVSSSAAIGVTTRTLSGHSPTPTPYETSTNIPEPIVSVSISTSTSEYPASSTTSAAHLENIPSNPAAAVGATCLNHLTDQPYFECDRNNNSDYNVCFPNSEGRAPLAMKCAPGTQWTHFR